jgi:hypothetical protein
MRYRKPDIIVILAVLVGMGVILTSAAQASGLRDQGMVTGLSGSVQEVVAMDDCSSCTEPKLHQNAVIAPHVAESAGNISSGIDLRMVDTLYGRSTRDIYHGTGMRYDFMFNRFRAVMYSGGGSVDLTLRLDNPNTPAIVLDPYLSLSVASHW